MSQKSIAATARRVRIVAVIAVVVMLAAFVAAGLGMDFGRAVTIVHRGIGGGNDVFAQIAAGLFLVSLIQLIRLLGRIEAGELFTASVTTAFRTFAFWLMLSALVAIAGPPLLGVASAITGHGHAIEFRISIRDVMFLISGLMMFLVARMLDEAAHIDSELREIV